MQLIITIDLVEAGLHGEDIKTVLDKFAETIQGRILANFDKYKLRGECNAPVGSAEVVS